jgi:hypothetical protein
VTADDLKEVMQRANLPAEYATQFINRARGARWWAKAITYDEFKSQAQDNESNILRAFCQLEVDSKGSIDVVNIKGARRCSRCSLARCRLWDSQLLCSNAHARHARSTGAVRSRGASNAQQSHATLPRRSHIRSV